MNILSLFSGVGGMDQGLERAGHQIVGLCEIDPKARSVLARHWPDTPIHDDVTTFDTKGWHGRVDIVAGGSPCQDLSVAGKRAGLDGERSGLFWHQCRIADELAAPWIVWENVAGALSSNKGADFSAVLWGLTGAFIELPDGKKWGNSGMVVGPKRAAVWRLLDAQWFGVAQRRKRVYVVAGPRDLCGPEILFERESVFRDSAPSRATGQEVAGTLGGGSGSRGWSPDTDRMTFVPQYWDGGQISDTVDVSMAVKGQMMPDKRRMFAVITSQTQDEQLMPQVSAPVTAKWATGSGGPSGDEVQNLVVTPFVKVIRSGARDADGNLPPEVWRAEEVAPTLNQFDVGETRATVVIPVENAIGFNWQNGGGYGNAHDGLGITDEGVGPISTSQVPAVAAESIGVRRLTPRECERLMGWNDDWTRWDDQGAEIADSHRYRMCGNGVVSNVAEWIGRRLPNPTP